MQEPSVEPYARDVSRRLIVGAETAVAVVVACLVILVGVGLVIVLLDWLLALPSSTGSEL
jgi:hypothetical protein